MLLETNQRWSRSKRLALFGNNVIRNSWNKSPHSGSLSITLLVIVYGYCVVITRTDHGCFVTPWNNSAFLQLLFSIYLAVLLLKSGCVVLRHAMLCQSNQLHGLTSEAWLTLVAMWQTCVFYSWWWREQFIMKRSRTALAAELLFSIFNSNNRHSMAT